MQALINEVTNIPLEDMFKLVADEVVVKIAKYWPSDVPYLSNGFPLIDYITVLAKVIYEFQLNHSAAPEDIAQQLLSKTTETMRNFIENDNFLPLECMSSSTCKNIELRF